MTKASQQPANAPTPPKTMQPVAENNEHEEVDERLLYQGHPAILPTAGSLAWVIVTAGLALVYFYFRARSIHYRITNQRVVVDRGIFSKTMDQIDLYRINDYVVERPLSQRLMGTGNLHLKAMDATTPAMSLTGIRADVMVLYEELRKATEEEKTRRGVRLVDYE